MTQKLSWREKKRTFRALTSKGHQKRRVNHQSPPNSSNNVYEKSKCPQEGTARREEEEARWSRESPRRVVNFDVITVDAFDCSRRFGPMHITARFYVVPGLARRVHLTRSEYRRDIVSWAQIPRPPGSSIGNNMLTIGFCSSFLRFVVDRESFDSRLDSYIKTTYISEK